MEPAQFAHDPCWQTIVPGPPSVISYRRNDRVLGVGVLRVRLAPEEATKRLVDGNALLVALGPEQPCYLCQRCGMACGNGTELRRHFRHHHRLPSAATITSLAAAGLEEVLHEERVAIRLGLKEMLKRRARIGAVSFCKPQSERVFYALGFAMLVSDDCSFAC